MTQSSYDVHTSCLICQGSDLRERKGYEQHYLMECQDCHFVFCRRIPTVPELIAHYNTYSRTDYLSPITVKRYHEILDFLEPYRQTNRLIDVGCGIGHFLQVAKERGWEVHGTEYTDEAIAICERKGINMKQGPLVPGNYEPGSFDVVVSIEVLEHIYNPVEEVENFRRILRNQGALYLTTPNFNSISRYYLKGNWSVIEYPEHLGYYTSNTLNRLLSNHGFQKKWIKTSGISLSRFQASLPPESPAADDKEHTGMVTQDSADEQLRKRIEGNPVLKFAKGTVNVGLDAFHAGDSMKGLFEKA